MQSTTQQHHRRNIIEIPPGSHTLIAMKCSPRACEYVLSMGSARTAALLPVGK
jgi:hypothetical protein